MDGWARVKQAMVEGLRFWDGLKQAATAAWLKLWAGLKQTAATWLKLWAGVQQAVTAQWLRFRASVPQAAALLSVSGLDDFSQDCDHPPLAKTRKERATGQSRFSAAMLRSPSPCLFNNLPP